MYRYEDLIKPLDRRVMEIAKKYQDTPGSPAPSKTTSTARSILSSVRTTGYMPKESRAHRRISPTCCWVITLTARTAGSTYCAARRMST